MGMLPHSISRTWSRFLYRFPIPVFITAIFLTGILPIISLYFTPVKLSPNAEVGFDTKDTPYSGGRLAWKKLSFTLQTSNRIQLFDETKSSSSPSNVSTATVSPRSRRDTVYLGGSERRAEEESFEEWKKQTTEWNRKREFHRRVKRSWGESLLSAFANVPCYDAPIPLMNHLSQVIFEVPTYADMWNPKFLKELCQMHNGIADSLRPFDGYTPFRNIWSVANFFACMSPNFLVNCTELTAQDVNTVHSLVDSCLRYRNQLVDCRLACGEQACDCSGIPKNCSTTMMFDLFYRILPMNLKSTPFYVNTFLPVFTRTGYATQNMWLPLSNYDALEESIKKYTKGTDLKLRGMLMELKRDRLLPAAIKDSFFSLLSACLVMCCVALHSRSISYAIAVLFQLLFSVTGALGIYAYFTSDFPLLLLVIFVLLIAVGTDDAFLLFSHFPEKLTYEGFHKAIVHTGSTMFLTSFSTAIPFFVNILSNVIVFRCFGLFAGFTILVNYFLVISFLPTFLIIQKRYFAWCPSLPEYSRSITSSMTEVFPQVILQGRFVWLASLLVLVMSCGFFAYKDLSLPTFNPLQLFTSENVHEWYDNHAEPNFQFVASKIAIPLHARLVWGIKPIESLAMFREAAITPMRSDPAFSLATVPDVKRLARTLTSFRALPFVNHTVPYWPEQFLTWSSRYPCSAGFLCCNVSSPIFTNAYLDYCLRNSTSYIFTQYNDTPIFDSETFALVGYTALLPTKLRYSHRFRNLSANVELIRDSLKMEGGWFTTEWYLMSTWFDLQRSIVSDCQSSVFISLAVVALFAIVQLRWQAIPSLICICCIITVSVGIVVCMGWVIGVLEAVILVLVVGLSFDFTLHYGAAIPQHGCSMHRVTESAHHAIAPVSLAAFSSVLAGAAMLFCSTHAFYQVGIFLVVSMSVSWLFSTFFFVPLLSFTLGSSKTCTKCERDAHAIHMDQKF